MNAETLYRLHFEATRHPSSVEELITMNGNLMIHNTRQNSYQQVSTTVNNIYRNIHNCITARKNKPAALFVCSCGICSQYLMGQIYSKMIVEKADDNILNKAINDVFSTVVGAVGTVAATIPLSSQNSSVPLNPPVIAPESTGITTSVQTDPISNPDSTFVCFDKTAMRFGKYKNKTYKEVFDSDREYCIWCIENLAIERSKHNRLNDKMLMFVSYVKQKIMM